MEFDLHIITNGNRANISFDYSNQNEIDTQQLKDAVNSIIDCLVLNSKTNVANNDFIKNGEILIQDNGVSNLTQPDYVKNPEPLIKYNGENLIDGAIEEKQNNDSNNDVTELTDKSYLSFIVVSKIKNDKNIA